MTDHITLSGLRARGYHGVFEHERHEGQEFAVDLRLWFDTRQAAASDDLSDTVDYGALAEVAARVLEGRPCLLIEALAARIAEAVLGADARIDECEVTVHKPQAPIPREFADVTVTIRRRRDD